MSSIQNNTLHPTQMVTLRSREYTQLLNGEDNSDILFQLDQMISVPPNVDVYVTLQVFRFINGMYNIPNTSHIFYWRGLKNGVWENFQYSVQIGNWNIDDLIVDLNANVDDIIFAYDPKTFKVTMTAHNGASHTEYEIQPLANNILARIGFDENTTISLLPTESILSPNLIDLLGTQNIYINIDDLQLSSVSTLGFGHKSVLDHVPIIVPQGTGQTHSGNGLMLKCGVKKITQLRVQLFTGEDKLAELNNTEWYMSLLFNFQYENEYRAPRYLTDVNGDGRIDMQDLIALFSQQQQQGNTL